MSEESKKSSLDVRNISIKETFKDLELIGSGGNAIVYSALKISTGDKVALKIYNDLDESVLEGIIDEFNFVTSLTSDTRCPKGILRYRDYFSSNFNNKPHYVLVTDLIDGLNIDHYMKKYYEEHDTFVLDDKTLLLFITQLSTIIAFIHNKSIVHRDIKKANIVYDGKDQFTLIDFEIACHTSNNKNFIIGTPWFLPPESSKLWNLYKIPQAELIKAQDIWSLGIILFELSHGFDPWNDRYTSGPFRLKSDKYGCHFRAMNDNKINILTNLCLKTPWKKRITADELIASLENTDITNEKKKIVDESPDQGWYNVNYLLHRFLLNTLHYIGKITF